MYRVLLIFLFHLINLCYNASGLDTEYSSSSNNNEDERHFSQYNDDDVDDETKPIMGYNEDERHFSEYNDDDVDNEKKPLMGLDYYGGQGFRDEYPHNSQEGPAQMQMAGPMGDSRDYGSNPVSKSHIVVLDSQDARNYKAELKAGNKADVLDANPNHYQPDTYPDYGRRRAVPPFIDVTRASKNVVQPDEPVPVWAPPEMVIAIAKESALLNAAEIKNPTDALIRKDILRTGNYWNAFWTEDVNPQLLRQKNEKQLDTIKVEVRPQSELYDLILKLKNMSPTLLYVLNNTI